MLIERSYTYYSVQKPFIDYFDRLYSVGLSFDDIERKLPEMKKYYDEIVLSKLLPSDDFYLRVNPPTIHLLFKDWKDFVLTDLIKF
jgi:hypothetical protein